MRPHAIVALLRWVDPQIRPRAANGATNTIKKYALHVDPPLEGAPNDYYLNSRLVTEHNSETWAIAYEASMDVPGGSTITFRTADRNCIATAACGRGSACESEALDRSEVVPASENAEQPFLSEGATVPWIHFDVTRVERL